MTRVHAFWAGLASLVFAATVSGEECAYTADRNAELPANGVRRVVIDAGAGTLKIRGAPSRSSVLVTGRACAAREGTLDEIQLKTRREGDTVYVTAELPEHAWNVLDWVFGELALDLVIDVPGSLSLEIEDSSGDAEIREVGPVSIKDSAGSLTVSGVGGNLSVEDGSGSVEVSGVRGALKLSDGSGPVSISDVTGAVQITDDGSGPLTIRKAGADVRIDHDGSGPIDIEHVAGGVAIGDDGSGSIDIRDVRGSVSVDHDGSGDIVVENVGGSLSVGDGGSGDVRYDRVTGNVRVPASD
jgi:DUF4097 and DUF4098 domain-containing protein YvlB